MQPDQELDVIPLDEAGTLSGLFRIRKERSPESVAYIQFDSESGKWRSYTWQEMGRLVGRWRTALASEGFGAGERVAILLRNSVEWVGFDQAALSLGLVVVPLYPSDSPDNIAYILADSGARLLLVQTQGRWETLAPLCAGLTHLKKVLTVQNLGETGKALSTDEKILLESLDDWLAKVASPFAEEPNPLAKSAGEKYPNEQGEYKYVTHEPDPHALATLVYTSGTTGRPKGVMLSHHNVLWDAGATLNAIRGYRSDIYLSLLPLSHMFERTVGYYVPMMAGSTVGFARSLKDLPSDIDVIRPTLLVAVPQIYDGIRSKIQKQLDQKGRFARLLVDRAIDFGWERFRAKQHHSGQTPPRRWLNSLIGAVLHPLVADEILSRFGGRLRIGVSGGGPLYAETARFFIGLGLPLIQGYGLTEASPVLAANRLDDNIPASVGLALAGVEIRLGENDELQARSPGVMLGYWNKPEETRAAIDAEGWLHTGDKASISNSHIFITGRIKEILVTSTGEKIPPSDVEMAITQDPLFEQAMAVGENKPYLTALLVLNRGEWEKLAVSLKLEAHEPGSLVNPAARAAVLKRIKSVLKGFPRYARIRAVHLTIEPWRVEDGLLTPTMKLKRGELQKRFAEQIAELYKKRPEAV
ncbi:MAG TPA: long-chain fatty acid--CoA ligase [Nitrosospira sp.]|nr:long-chain fatty acid--CoA ligase [Nitrosospira sp.]